MTSNLPTYFVEVQAMSIEHIRRETEAGAICIDYQQQLLAEIDRLQARVDQLESEVGNVQPPTYIDDTGQPPAALEEEVNDG